MTAKEELIRFGRALFETTDNAAALLPAIGPMLTEKRFDDIFVIVQCSFINTNYFGVKYNSQLRDASIEERYFDRLMEIFLGLRIPENEFMPLIIAAFNPRTAGEIGRWARPARAYFLALAYRDFDKAVDYVNKLCFGQKFALDALYQCDPDRTVEYLLEQLKTCNFYQAKLVREFLAYRAPELLPPKKTNDALPENTEINVSTFQELIDFCASHRDAATVKRIRQGMKLMEDNDFAAMADYLLCDYDASTKRTSYLSSFFAKYGSDHVKALLSASIDPGDKKKFSGVLNALDLSVDDIMDEKADDMELDASGRKLFVIDGFNLYIAVTNGLGVVMQDENGNSFTFSEGRVPARYRLIKKHIDRYMKALSDELKKQKDRMYEAFKTFRLWRHQTFLANIVKRPLLSCVASEFFWGEYRGEKLISVFYIENGGMYDLNKNPYTLGSDSFIALIHPVDLEGQFEFLKRLSVTQPFDQLRREAFTIPASVPFIITRFHGTVIHSETLQKNLKRFGWKPVKSGDGSIGAARKYFTGTTAELSFQNIYPDVDALITVGNCKLIPRVPVRRIYSEIAYEIFMEILK